MKKGICNKSHRLACKRSGLMVLQPWCHSDVLHQCLIHTLMYTLRLHRRSSMQRMHVRHNRRHRPLDQIKSLEIPYQSFFFFLSKLKRRLLKFFECFSGTWEASQHHDGGQKILHTLRNLDVNHPCVLYCNMAINKMKCISFLLCFLTPRSTRKPVAYLSQSKAPLRLHPSNIIPI